MRAVWWLPILHAFLPISSANPPCRCVSFQACWPSTSEFSQLEAQLSRPLIKPTSPASACYPPSHPSGNCTDVLSRLNDGYWRSNFPGEMQSINFETYTFKNGTIDACYYNTTLGFPCGQGNIPVLGVDARSIGDIQAAVRFVKRHNLRLVIKNTGHDLLGRSTARGGFMLWTHGLKYIDYNEHFIPEGALSDNTYQALTLGAGVQWREAYDTAESYGRAIVGGLSPGGSVGAAGGWVLGGGHGPLSPKYGLGVDNAIQFTLVLASGEYVTANQYTNSDLFWALRGGGGGTFGVIVTVTYRTHERLPVSSSLLVANFSTPAIAHSIITEFIKLHPGLSDAGWGGFSFYSNSSIQMFYVGVNISLSDANATMSPFFDHVSTAIQNPQDVVISLKPYKSYYQWYSDIYPTIGQVGVASELISRLMSRRKAEEEPANVAEAVLSVTNTLFAFVAGGTVSRINPDSAGVHPAWRESVGLVYSGTSWEEGTPTAEINRLRQVLLDELKYLDLVSPNSATYFNEGSLYEKDFRTSFFGSHYADLKIVKRKYDADDLFLVAKGVGSEDWDTSLNCRRSDDRY